MPTLAEVQQRVRRAVVLGDQTDLSDLLIGGRHPGTRVAIHQRHYESSLVNVLLDKFPATAWLIGSERLVSAAQDFVHAHPPNAPCMAEYGADFPMFLASRPEMHGFAYLFSFSQLEWHLGHAAVATDRAAVSIETLSRRAPSALLDSKLVMQPCVAYLKASWPVDELMSVFLSDSQPDEYRLEALNVWLEVRGARGSFSMKRLNAGEFEFRRTIAGRHNVGSAVELALQIDPDFDVPAAFAGMFAEALVVSVSY